MKMLLDLGADVSQSFMTFPTLLLSLYREVVIKRWLLRVIVGGYLEVVIVRWLL